MACVGEIRPSQLMFSYGVGSIADLPQFSALVMGLDFWNKATCPLIVENRLLSAVRQCVGQQVEELRLPPVQPENGDQGTGVPVAPFPRWMRCTACGYMAPLEGGVFKQEERMFQPVRFVHATCRLARSNKAPRAVPVRFLFACPNGHMYDVPWSDFVHDGKECAEPRLYMSEFGVVGSTDDIWIRCDNCGAKKRLTTLFEKLHRGGYACMGLHPHLRKKDARPCTERPSLITLGASNLWFPQSLSVLSIPDNKSELEALVKKYWEDLQDADEGAIVWLSRPNRHPELADFAVPDILRAIEEVRNAQQQKKDVAQIESDIKLPEWNILTGSTPVEASHTLEVKIVDAPTGCGRYFEKTTLVPRLTEVRAMYGFTRLSTQQELDLGIVKPLTTVPLTREPARWLPAYESRGEGIFLRFREDRLQAWESSPNVQAHNELFFRAHQAWRKSRRYENVYEGYPGIRFVLLHSFSHALMQQIVLDCGYTAASIRERLYCRTADMDGGPMAGVLLYTAASDSEGTLGGLVSLGTPDILGRYIQQAMESMRLCTADPLCAERMPEADGRSIHGASCHACLFSPETSCECGNRYLDRNVLVSTFATRDNVMGYWEKWDE